MRESVGLIYRRVLGHPVPQDIQHSVGRSPPDDKLLVTVSLIGWEPCRKYITGFSIQAV